MESAAERLKNCSVFVKVEHYSESAGVAADLTFVSILFNFIHLSDAATPDKWIYFCLSLWYRQFR